jgi:hypothetical protein
MLLGQQQTRQDVLLGFVNQRKATTINVFLLPLQKEQFLQLQYIVRAPEQHLQLGIWIHLLIMLRLFTVLAPLVSWETLTT